MLEEQLIEALGTIDSLQKVVYEEQGKKEQAEKQVLQLKVRGRARQSTCTCLRVCVARGLSARRAGRGG
jgi:hypothetical protein